MKIVNLRALQITIVVLLLSTISLVLANSMSFGLLKKTKKTEENNSNQMNIEKPKNYGDNNEAKEKNVYYEGWVKYLHYSESDKGIRKAFFKNTYFSQQERNPNMKKYKGKDKHNTEFKIPSELHFYAIVYGDSINILNSRMDEILRVTDSLSIDYIDPIPDKDRTAGGVLDFGKFSEGYCIKMRTKVPSTNFIQTAEKIQPSSGEYTAHNWIICLDTRDQKDKFYNLMIQLKLKRQHDKNIYIEVSENKNKISSNNHTKELTGKQLTKGSTYEGGESPNDCKMIILQDWTPCNLACGGGHSYLQLLKVEAKNGGKDCKTKDTILKRSCNNHACPTAGQINALKGEIERLQDIRTENNKLIPIKSVRISNRPQRYDKCHLKETDALMEKKDETLANLNLVKNAQYPLVPVRLVMNDKTLTAYQDDNLQDKIVTYLLEETALIKTDDYRRCFILKNNVNSSKFCMLDASKGNFLEEWFYDYNLFKHQCKKEREKSDKFFDEEKKLEKEYKQKVDKIKMELVQNKADAVKKEFEEEEKKKYEKKITQFRKMSFSAFQKELRLEDLLEKEEESREQMESESLEQEIQKEKKKEETLVRVIKQKELESQLNVAKNQAERAIQEIKKNTQSQILKQRQLVAKKIIEMRQKRKRKNAELKSRILSIRSNIADKLKNINRKGEKAVCQDPKNIDSYCTKYFSDNFVKMGDCKVKESFCYVCCENEFGELHILERDQCYATCDKN